MPAPDPMQLLPPRLREIARVAGVDAALQISQGWPGVRLYIPQRMHAQHPIALAIGLDSARKLAREMGDQTVSIPRGVSYRRQLRNALIISAYQGGRSARELALEYGLHEAYIYTLVASAGAQRQQDLFAP